MSDDAGCSVVERARSVVARGGWQQAFDLFMEADADGLLGPTDLLRGGAVWPEPVPRRDAAHVVTVLLSELLRCREHDAGRAPALPA